MKHKKGKEKQGLLEMEQLKYAVVEANNKGVEAVYDTCDLVGSISCSSESGISSESCLESADSFEEVTSPPCSSPSGDDHVGDDSLSDMSSLIQQLPIKRGISKYYQGKAQSFTSLAKVNSLEDLIKPENPYNKKLKSCRSYGGKMNETLRAKCTPSAISRKRLHSAGARSSCYPVSTAERGSGNFTRSRPQIPPHRSTSSSNIPNQTALFV